MSLLTGLLIGVLAGFGAMILLAPQSGKRASVRIEQKSIDLLDRTIDTFNELVA
jgi:gas vesicle protein